MFVPIAAVLLWIFPVFFRYEFQWPYASALVLTFLAEAALGQIRSKMARGRKQPPSGPERIGDWVGLGLGGLAAAAVGAVGLWAMAAAQ